MNEARRRILPTGLLFGLVLLLLACGAAPSSEAGTAISTDRGGSEFAADDVASAEGSELRIFFVDVGQGSSVVVLSPEGRVVVYDAGTRRGGQATVSLLRRLGVERVDLAIMSHAHNDHLGGFIDIIDNFEVMRFMDPGMEHDSQVYLRLLDALAANEIPIFLGESGRRVRIDSATEIEILGPSQPFLRGTRSDLNSNSIILRVHHGSHNFLLMGDAETPTEERLLSEGNLAPTDVLLVAHHGSAHSSTARFLDAVTPRFAVIQSGANNSYGHPAPAALERLAASGVERIYRNDLHGTIEVRSDGRELHFIPERNPPETR